MIRYLVVREVQMTNYFMVAFLASVLLASSCERNDRPAFEDNRTDNPTRLIDRPRYTDKDLGIDEGD